MEFQIRTAAKESWYQLVGEVVGRGQEVSALRRILDDRGLVTVIGPAGIGKSSVAASALEDRIHLSGGGLPSLRYSPFFAFEAALRRRLDGALDDVAQQVLDCFDHSDGGVLLIEDLHWTHPTSTALLKILRDRLPLVVTARPGELSPDQRVFVDSAEVVELRPLSDSEARRVVRRRWPSLSSDGVADAVALAGGNPLLLELLPVSTDAVAPSMSAAICHRLAALDPGEFDCYALLALRGRPSPCSMIGLDGTAELLVTMGDDVWFRHPYLAEVFLEVTVDDLPRLHAELALRVPADEAAEQHLGAGDSQRALEVATEAAAAARSEADRARQLNIAVLAMQRLGRVDDELRIRAAAALNAAQLYPEALEVAAAVETTSGTLRAQALFQIAHARRLSGDLDGARESFSAAAECAQGCSDELRTRIHVDYAYLEVRDRVPDALLIAREAMRAAELSGTQVLRARAVLGAALLYAQLPGWEAQLEQVIDEAHAAGEDEVAFEAAWHLTSGLGFTARLAPAQDVNEVQIRRAASSGFRTWQSHFEGAWLINQALLGTRQREVVARATELMTNRRSFRNRAQAMAAASLTMGDLDRATDAIATTRDLRATAASDDERAWAAVAGAEIAWQGRDSAGMHDCLALGRAQGDAWFGLRVMVEIAAQHVAFENGYPAPDIDLPTTVLPTLWPALDEIEGFSAWHGGDTDAAVRRMERAADGWLDHAIPRFGARARFMQATMLARSKVGRATATRRAAVGIARTHGLAGHLRHWNEPLVDGLSAREVEVLERVAVGLTSRQIADELGLAVDTVDGYVLAARNKLGARTRREAALLLTSGVRR